MAFGPVSAPTIVLGRTGRSAARVTATTGRRTTAAEVTRRARRGSIEVLGRLVEVLLGTAADVSRRTRRRSVEVLGWLVEVLRRRTVRDSTTEVTRVRRATCVGLRKTASRGLVVRKLRGATTARPTTGRRGTAMGNRTRMIFEATVLRAMIHRRTAGVRATDGTTMRTTGATRSHHSMA